MNGDASRRLLKSSIRGYIARITALRIFASRATLPEWQAHYNERADCLELIATKLRDDLTQLTEKSQ